MAWFDNAAPLRLVCLPSSDLGFADAVQTVVAQSPWIETPAQLSEALQPYFPSIRVRVRDLSGELERTWYVYRDGAVAPPSDD